MRDVSSDADVETARVCLKPRVLPPLQESTMLYYTQYRPTRVYLQLYYAFISSLSESPLILSLITARAQQLSSTAHGGP